MTPEDEARIIERLKRYRDLEALAQKDAEIEWLRRIKQRDRCFKIGVENKAHTCKPHDANTLLDQLAEALEEIIELHVCDHNFHSKDEIGHLEHKRFKIAEEALQTYCKYREGK